jgi:hypothetical protein
MRFLSFNFFPLPFFEGERDKVRGFLIKKDGKRMPSEREPSLTGLNISDIIVRLDNSTLTIG